MLIKTILSWCVACFIFTALPISGACAFAAESKAQTPEGPGEEPAGRTGEPTGGPAGGGQPNSNTKRGPRL
ncbi:MAG: hypothetical protein Q8R83_03475 [Legionellaceae bacterium]|nr:hypothetical protein [Legionellaceae bacterium]